MSLHPSSSPHLELPHPAVGRGKQESKETGTCRKDRRSRERRGNREGCRHLGGWSLAPWEVTAVSYQYDGLERERERERENYYYYYIRGRERTKLLILHLVSKFKTNYILYTMQSGCLCDINSCISIT